ncbi:MAG TPA: FAD-dependent oxidoreductase [Candidatus Acidoferrales bacterium]|jgi:ferredoxin-NADP reductase|nr:FAD-dependent oxidoreductase [Candidatus Acidoferrales bacterium]
MAEFQITLKKRQEIAAGTMAFYFEKPPGFTFLPGQAVDLTLLNPPETDAEGNTRAFSIASAPSEDDLMFATRMRDTAFKRVLGRMPLGGRVKLDGPWGDLTLHSGTRSAVFLTGGIGITPFRSMLVQAAIERSPLHYFLFYSNRRPEDAAFLHELQNLALPTYKLIATMTQPDQSSQPWHGETGYLKTETIAKNVGSLIGPIYYAAGPPVMVEAMRKMMTAAGVPADDLRTEDFSGY